MARYLGPVCKLSRREGLDLLHKLKPIESKCRLDRQPGQHAAPTRRPTDYALQLREKQKMKRMYCLLERQFRRYYHEAVRRRGSTGDNLWMILESRLDNIVYRMGFGGTRKEARQLVSHKAVQVNGRTVNVASKAVRIGDVVSINEPARAQSRIQSALKYAAEVGFSDWVEMDVEKQSGVFKRLPERNELSSDVNESLVIELYSK